KTVKAPFEVLGVAVVQGALVDAYFVQRPVNAYLGCLHETYDLVFLLFGESHVLPPFYPKPFVLFLSTRFWSRSSATVSLSWEFSPRSSFISLVLASRMVSPISRFFPASKKSLLQR